MADWDVYGIGGAILDTTFRVDDDFLIEQDIEKGHVTFVNSEDIEQLANRAAGSLVSSSSGGSAANSLAVIPCLGGKSFYCCRVGRDSAGSLFLDELAKAGVNTNMNLDEAAKDEATSKCLVLVTPDGERSILVYIGASRLLSRDHVDKTLVARSSWAYMEGYLAADSNTTDTAVYLRECAMAVGTKTAANLGDYNIIKNHRPHLELMLGSGIDLLFCNAEEALLWTGCSDLESAGKALLTFAKTCVITRGPKGAFCFDGRKWFDAEGFKVKPVDTNGAGDSFAGAFLAALSRRRNYRSAATMANLVAAFTVTHTGSRSHHLNRDALVEIAGVWNQNFM